ncbi:MAG: Lrp/AsnC family transcriptional regulator [Candidatus Obscuribacterales bacterium]|nr:Lrp/AsnC family transcriptional regulator [Candidatus Obscuribacterales bacterium]
MINLSLMISEPTDEILSILSRDARVTAEQIAKMTGRELKEVKAAIEAYEKSGVIKRYKAIIDWEKAGVEKVLAFIDVQVAPAREVGFDKVAFRISRFPEVMSVWLVSGTHDLRVLVQGDNLRELGRFVAEKLSTIEGIRATETHFMMRRYKEDNDLFVDSDEDNRLLVTP